MSNTLDSIFKSYDLIETFFERCKQSSVLLMDSEGIIKQVNKSFTNSFGYTDDDIIGKHTSILFTEEDQKKGLPETELGKVLSEGQATDKNYLVHKNKTKTWVTGESVKVKNDKGEIILLKIIQDIHEQKVSEIAIRQLNEFNENILSSIEDVVIVLNDKMKVVKANKAFSNLFNNVPDINNLDLADLIKPYDINGDLQKRIQETIKTRAGFSNKEIEIETASGEKRIFDVSCRAMEDGNENNILLVVHDITVYKQAERQREDIIGFVAHELRNPLANIVLCNELMAETIKEKSTNETLDLLSRSKSNVMRLNKMIAELYDATKVSSGNLSFEKANFHFGEMIKEAISTIEVLYPLYKIEVKGSGDFIVNGDRFRLIQVVTNYLSNGIKYSLGNADVSLTIEHDKENAIVAVRDKGLGISKNQLPHVFSRFFRAEKTKNLEGIGLGLYLCHQIITGHNGKVWAESEEGKGSTFYFSIPLR